MNARFSLLLALVSCADMSRSEKEAPMSPSVAPMQEEAPSGGFGARGSGMGGGGAAPGLGGMGRKMDEMDGVAMDKAVGITRAEVAAAPTEALNGAEKDKESAEPAPTRSWFPESFLWLPSVQTDATGTATVTFPVPDSLTTWRVLGLGWTREGAQGGAELSVLSTLPAYVDVVVPGSLYAGDRVELPIQVMNTTDGDLSAALDVSVVGASGAGHGNLKVPAGGSATQRVSVTAERSGIASVHAQFGSVDTVERTVPIRPAGSPADVSGAGAVGGAVVEVPAGNTGPDGEIVVTVWAGATSVLREEIVGGGVIPMEDMRLPSPGVSDASYRFALALAGATLDKTDVDPEALRTLRIRSWLPITRAGRAPDTRTACLLAEALRDAPEHTLERDLRDRMVEQVRREQAPDGTWLVGATNIDGTLAETAACARAAGADDSVRVRAEGAFARNVSRLEDPYLAAWALASGAIKDPELVERLTAKVTAALVRDTNGAHLPAAGAVRGDGLRVSDAEATAVAALALAAHDEDAKALATGLLALRSPWGGWGDGRASLVALRALSTVFTLDAPKSAAVELSVDGQVAAQASVATDQGHAAITLRAPWSGAAAKVEVRTATAAPGLVYTWRARSYGPWAATSGGPAEVATAVPSSAKVGQVAALHLRIAVPTDVAADVRVGLPAGVHPDPAGMDSVVSAAGFGAWEAAEGYLTLRGVPSGGWEGDLPVIPALSGQLSSGPTRVYVGEEAVALAVPSRWLIGQ